MGGTGGCFGILYIHCRYGYLGTINRGVFYIEGVGVKFGKVGHCLSKVECGEGTGPPLKILGGAG